jgi:hypothetical protein
LKTGEKEPVAEEPNINLYPILKCLDSNQLIKKASFSNRFFKSCSSNKFTYTIILIINDQQQRKS